MDVEKTIQFLIETAAQHDERLAAIETSLLTLGNGLINLTAVVRTLAETVEATHKEIDRFRDQMLARDAQSRERDRILDERISKLVSAIAAMGRTNPGNDQS